MLVPFDSLLTWSDRSPIHAVVSWHTKKMQFHSSKPAAFSGVVENPVFPVLPYEKSTLLSHPGVLHFEKRTSIQNFHAIAKKLFMYPNDVN